MDTIQIKTPMNVNVEVLHAGIGRRLGAFVIDVLIIIAYIWGISYVFFDLLSLDLSMFDLDDETNYGDRVSFLGVIYQILLFPALFYSLLTETLFNGQTFGKMLTNIRVVKLDGYRAGFSEYFTRWAFRFVDFWTGSFLLLFLIPIFGEELALVFASMVMTMPGLFAVVMILKTKNHQRLGDLIAGTTVLKLKEKHSINITILEEIKETYTPRYPQVIKLSDNDARIIKDTFRIAQKGKDYRTIKRLRKKLEEVMEVESDQRDWEFVETVMKDFNYYTQKL